MPAQVSFKKPSSVMDEPASSMAETLEGKSNDLNENTTKKTPHEKKPLLPLSMRGNAVSSNSSTKTKTTTNSRRRSVSPGDESVKSPRRPRTRRPTPQPSSYSSTATSSSRFTSFFRLKSSKQRGEGAANVGQDDNDPVMALFRARATHRVRFALDPPTSSNGTVAGESITSATNSQSSIDAERSKSVKKFVKNALFGKRRSSEFEAEAAKFGMAWDQQTPVTSCSSDEMRPETPDRSTTRTNPQSSTIGSMPSAKSPDCTPTRRTSKSSSSPSSTSHSSSPSSSSSSKSSPKASLKTALPAFVEDKETRAQVIKLLNKANRAHHVHFRYEYSVKCCMRALELLKEANYPDDHPTVMKTLQSLNASHHALSSLDNSANIVKMGIKYEDAGDWIRALKMFTVAYRIRRDNLGPHHPSLTVLLNMLGSIQVKRNELEEAMDIFELALKDDPVSDGEDELSGAGSAKHANEGTSMEQRQPPNVTSASTNTRQKCSPGGSNVLAKSVAYREMGTIYEKWGDVDEALSMYHKSLDCIAKCKGIDFHVPATTLQSHHSPVSPMSVSASATSPSSSRSSSSHPDQSTDSDVNNTTISTCPLSITEHDILLDLESVQHTSFVKHTTVMQANHIIHAGDDVGDEEEGGMELCLESPTKSSPLDKTMTTLSTPSCYDVFFPDANRRSRNKKSKSKSSHPSSANVDVALTLHQIGQLHRTEGEYHLALSAYAVALRGMKHELGANHPNVAAILGNIGNLQKEMGDLTAAYETYQQVLAIESYRLGLSHPDVAVTLHNIATIDAARGNHQHAITLYEQVLALQRKLFGDDHISLAVTATCMGDVYERTGEVDKAIDVFEVALRIKTAVMGRHSIEVGRILHKLGKLSALNGDVQLADSYLSRTVLIYRLNKLQDDDTWMVEANRDIADIDAVIAMGRTEVFEC